MSAAFEQRRTRKPVLRNHGVMPITLNHLDLCEPAELSRTTLMLQQLCFRTGLVRNRSSQNTRIRTSRDRHPQGGSGSGVV